MDYCCCLTFNRRLQFHHPATSQTIFSCIRHRTALSVHSSIPVSMGVPSSIALIDRQVKITVIENSPVLNCVFY
ncbi:Uncharacterised protein [Salmonella enterica subsp. enterica]|uniref:Uncharacterized protein n=1 Tax=Salmonella enterica I TaxID=59201 RepID=A0A3S4ISW6_SALET|nr:Uncharacterised protein [Salmonella enterica subsp. enterica]